MEDSFFRLKNWLLDSGLVVRDNDQNIGGAHSFYDEQKQEYGFLYPEITGYFISTLRFLYDLKPNDDIISQAKQSADWLMKVNESYGGIIQGISDEKIKEKLVYSFDVGICIKGILDCYYISKEEKYLDFARSQAQWLIDEAINGDGTIKPLKNLFTKKFEEDNSVWYKQSGCLHVKTSIPFFQLYSITKEPIYLEKANLICNNFSRYVNNDGSVSIHENSKIIHLHTLCYALEGLIYGYATTSNKKFLTECIKSAKWCSQQIIEDGSINLWFNSKYQQAKTSYHIAQLIRILLLLDSINNNKKNSVNIEKLYKFLLTLQCNSDDKKSDGGFYEELFHSMFSWKKRQRINSWGSMFAIQAIFWKNNSSKINLDSIKYLY